MTKQRLSYPQGGEQTVKNIARLAGACRLLSEPKPTETRGAGFKAQSTLQKMAVIRVTAVLVVVVGAARWHGRRWDRHKQAREQVSQFEGNPHCEKEEDT